MPKDIRSYFKTIKAPKEEPKRSDDDSDVIPDSPNVQIASKVKKKETRKKRVFDDSSDEEVFDKKNKKQSKSEVKKAEKKLLKEVNAADMFGTGPIKRTEPIVKKEKQLKTEIGIHDDEEFEKSLMEIDNIDELINNNSVQTESKPEPSKSPTTKSNYNAADSLETDSKAKSSKLENYKIPKNKSEEQNDKTIKKEEKREEEHKRKNKKDKVNIETKSSEKKKQNKLLSPKVEKTNSLDSLKNEKKRDFSEFLNDDQPVETEKLEPSNKKKKLDTSLNSSVLSDEERFERKRQSAALYKNYLNRSGPKHLGAKQMPEGSPGCLKNCAFLLTGVLDSFERDEVVEAIQKYGGTIKSGISKKVTHVLAGDDAGPAKISKAQDLGIKIINEDQFLTMISKGSDQNVKSTKLTTEKVKPEISKKDKTPNKREKHIHNEKSSIDDKPAKVSDTKPVDGDGAVEKKEKVEKKIRINEEVKKPVKFEKIDVSKENTSSASITQPTSNSVMWVDKYKPQSIKSIIGQHGDSSNVKKLMNWLTNWYANRKKQIPKPSPWAKNDDGGYFKAALLSGPPGVGKTTTVSLVCKELGFDTVEFNASDTRSKSLIKEQIGELLTTTSLSGYATGVTGKQAVSKKHVLIMDEVDGMAGNEDRGGLQELISIIKTSAVPIICICNDRNSDKMRTLVNYCYDLKFERPRVDQIKAAMLSICCKENVKIPVDALVQLIVASNQDIRQTLNSLSMWAIDSGRLDAEELKKSAEMSKKNFKLGPWEVVRKVFSASDHKTMSINDKMDLFFYDYNISPLFVQENYLIVSPNCPKNEVLDRISEAADSISYGDVLEATIRGSQAWSLLPMQAICSSVIPGTVLSGHVAGQIQFPGWLGKNSRANKMKRLAQEIHAHTRLSTTGSKSSIYLDYSKHLRDAIVTPLIKNKSEGIEQAIDVLKSYHLLREDLDSLTELSLWPGQRDPMILVDSKVKAAMTRAYNKQAPALPHAAASISKGKKTKETVDGEECSDEDDNNADSDPEHDAMIKVKKKTSKSKAKPEEASKPSTSKVEKGKKGKGKK